MKRLLLSLFVLVAFTGVTFAHQFEVPPLEVTVESVDDSVTMTLEVAGQYARNAATPIATKLGPRADSIMYDFRTVTGFLATEGVNASELTLLYEEAEQNYLEARTAFSKGLVLLELADVFVSEAEDTEGTAAYILCTQAVVYRYEAASCFERSCAALETVIALGVKGEAVTEELENRPTQDSVTGRYRLRSRVNRLFSRSKGRRV